MAIIESLLAGYIDTSGNPLANGKVYFYDAGTTSPKDVFTDENMTLAWDVPVVLDELGQAQVYASGNYKIVITDSNDVEIATFDEVRFGISDGGGAEVTNIADGTELDSGVTVKQIRNDEINAFPTIAGTGDAIALTSPTTPSLSYVTGQRYRFQSIASNTTAVTIEVDSLGAKNVKKYVGSVLVALTSGDILSGGIYDIVYDGTQFILLNARGNNSAVVGLTTSDATVSNTTTETTIFTFAVPAGILSTNRGYRLKMFGVHKNDTGSTRDFTWNLKYGSTTIATNVQSITTETGDRNWVCDAILLADASASAQKGMINPSMIDVKATQIVEATVGYGTGAENSATALNLVVSMTLSAASASLYLVLKGAVLEFL